jgi:hypothetical protein
LTTFKAVKWVFEIKTNLLRNKTHAITALRRPCYKKNFMSTNRFFILLSTVSLGVSLMSLLLGQIFATFQQYGSVTWWSLGIFIPLSIAMFFGGKIAAKSVDKYIFSNLIMPFTFLKMFLSVAGLVVYKKIYHPETKFFLLPFFFVYLIFTIFETFFMVKLSKTKY